MKVPTGCTPLTHCIWHPRNPMNVGTLVGPGYVVEVKP